MERSTSADVLMTRRNVACGYDSRSDGLSGTAMSLPMSLTPELCGFDGAYAEENLCSGKRNSEEEHYPRLLKVHGNNPTIIASRCGDIRINSLSL
jgi:hypothetical protein